MSSLISIIVPVFNGEDYLCQCLESIAVQTYTHFECILVDDGSTDRSVEICKFFCEKDDRFRLIHQNNEGASSARNAGLDEARGDYILFVDSDDFLFPEALQQSWQKLVSGPFDWVMFDYIRIDSSDEIPSPPNNKDASFKRLDRETALRGLLDSRNPSYAVVWNKLYTRRIIGNTRFKPVRYAEDFLFNYEIISQTQRYIRTDQYYYCWRIRMGSLTAVNNPARFLSQLESMMILEDISRGDDPAMRALCLNKIFKQLIIARFHLRGTSSYLDFISIAERIRDNSFKEYLLHSGISLFDKVRVVMLWLCPHISNAIIKARGN